MIQLNKCIICLQDIDNSDNIKSLNCYCEYNYHNECINKWLNINNTCPVCRKILKNTYNIMDDNDVIRFCVHGPIVYHIWHVHLSGYYNTKQIIYIYLQLLGISAIILIFFLMIYPCII